MSLINKVLGSLERRNALASAGGPIAPQIRPLRQPGRPGRWILSAVGLMAVAGLGRVGWTLYELRPAQALVTVLAVESDAMARTEPPAAPAAPAPTIAAEPAAADSQPEVEAEARALPLVDALKLAPSIETPIPERPASRPKPKQLASAAPALPREASIRKQVAEKPLLPELAPAAVEKRERQRTPPEQAEAQFARAMALLNEGRVAEAEGGLIQALQLDPRHMGARQALVALRLEQRRVEDAVPVLKSGLEIDPGQIQFGIVLARIQAERHDYAAALSTLAAVKGGDGRPEFDNLAAALLQKLSRDREAVERYRSALRVAPNNGASWMGLGISLEKLAQPADAAEAYARALASNTLAADARAYVEQRVKELR